MKTRFAPAARATILSTVLMILIFIGRSFGRSVVRSFEHYLGSFAFALAFARCRCPDDRVTSKMSE